MSALDAALYVDGARVASTAQEFDAGITAALSGLTVTWGRRTVVDQPDADSASFQVAQRDGRAAFLQQLRTGAQVEIRASGLVYPDPDLEAFTDPGFEDAEAGSRPPQIATNLSATITADIAHSGAQALQLHPLDAALPGRVILPPAPFTTAPDGWDHLPRTDEGQVWRVGAWVQARAGAIVTVRGALFPSPASGTPTLTGESVTLTASGSWQELPLAFTPLAGYFVGVAVEISGWGPNWPDLPGSWAEQPGTWRQLAEAFVDDIQVLSPAAGVLRDVVVFSGRITDLSAEYDPLAGGALNVSATARSFPADMANTRIGDAPWPVQTLEQRVDRILELAGLGITARISPTIQDLLVAPRDVDSQPAQTLIRELAASAAAVAWTATHATTGPYYFVEDPGDREALESLRMVEGVVIVIPNPAITDAIHLDAGNILRDPLRWIQDVSDLATRADVAWQEAGVDGDGKLTLTERHVVLIDEGLEAEYGIRGISLTTQLQAAADAGEIAALLLARLGDPTAWRLEGVEWNTRYEQAVDPEELLAALNLLDGTIRIGRPLRISGLPQWAPERDSLTAYVEGGTYSYERGAWRLALTVSRAGAAQGHSAPWQDLPAEWAWAEFDPGVTWAELYGVSVSSADIAHHDTEMRIR